MCEVLGDISLVKARKEHNDNAFDFVSNSLDLRDMTLSEAKSYVRRQKLGGVIRKGEKYFRYTLIVEGDICCNKESQDMRELCLKYDLFEDC